MARRQLWWASFFSVVLLAPAALAQTAPSITKLFTQSPILAGQTTPVTFTISTGFPSSNVSFSDPLPSGLVVATPNGLSGSCGTVTAVPGTSTISLTGANLPINGSCSFSVSVLATTAGTFVNTTSNVTNAVGGVGNQATDVLVAVPVRTPQPPVLSKFFGQTSIAPNQAARLNFILTNPNSASSLTGIGFSDTLPGGLLVAAPNGVAGSCGGGTVTATAGSGAITLTGATLAPGAACSFSVNVVAAVAGTYLNRTSAVISNEGGSGDAASGTLLVAVASTNAPSITKLFTQSPILAGQTTPVTFTISTGFPSSNVSFSDPLPSGLVVATPNGLSGSCGTVTAVPGTSTISLTGANLPINGSCSFSVSVLATTAGTFVNTTSNVTNAVGGVGNQATDVLVAVPVRTPQPPVLSKFFGQTSIAPNQAARLNFILTNPNSASSLTGIGFSDTLPGGLLVAAPNGVAGSCGGGTVTATAGSGAITLTGATLAPGAACSFSVNVVAAVAGTYLNRTSAVISNEGGSGDAASGTLLVAVASTNAPSITKLFTQSPILAGQTTPVTFTISTGFPSSNVSFSDPLPSGLVVATPNGLSGSCGTVTAVPGTSTISLTGANLPINGSCSFSVSVLATTAGTFVNTTSNVTNAVGGVGNQATDVLVAVPVRTPQPPVLSKFFGQTSIAPNQAARLNFILTNPNSASSLTGIGFSDTLPGGLLVAAPNGVAGSCGGGTVTATAGSGAITLTGATLAPGAACSFSVNVVAAVAGTYLNRTSAVISNEGGSGDAASGTLLVAVASTNAPSITKLFTQSPILAGQTTPVTFTISTGFPSSNVSFSDPLPSGLVVATPNGLSGSCGTVTAVPGTSTISLTGANLPINGSCSFSVSVLATTAGTFVNTTSNVTNAVGGVGNQATDVLVAVPVRTPQPPVLSKFFGQTSIAPNQAARLNFILTNPNSASSLTGIGFSDTLPGGLLVAAPNGVAGSCGGGTVTATAGSGAITLTGATLAPGAACSFSVNVVAAVAGTYLNRTSAVISNEGGSGDAASGTLLVAVASTNAPSITKLFTQSPILAGQTTPVTFTISTGFPSSNVSFSDPLPSGLVVATPNGLSGSCGTVTAVPGTSTISLTGANLPINGSCSFSVSVLATTAGTFVNTTSNVTNAVGGVGNQATDVLVAVPVRPPAISKTFTPSKISVNGVTNLTFTIANPDPNPTLTNVAFSDTLPAGVVVTAGNPVTGTCGGGTLAAVPGSGIISLAGATLSAGASCTFSVNVTGPEGQYSNTVAATATGAGITLTSAPSTAALSVANPPILTKSFAQVSIGPKGTIGLTFILRNSNATTTLTDIAFDDLLPAGLKIASPSAVNGVCDSGTITAAANSSSISLAGASLAPGATCTFAVNVMADGTVLGVLTNITSAPTSVQSPAGNAATASIFIGDPFQVTYVSNLSVGDSVINITNTGASGASLQSGTTASITGALCANIYAFTPDEQLVSCCSCPVTPNGLVSLSARNDLISNTLTPAVPTSLVVKVIGTAPAAGSCNNSAAAVAPAALANGITSFGTTLHGMNAPGNYAVTERPLSSATLSSGELSRVGSLCNFILANGSGFGICRSCRLGGLGADSR